MGYPWPGEAGAEGTASLAPAWDSAPTPGGVTMTGLDPNGIGKPSSISAPTPKHAPVPPSVVEQLPKFPSVEGQADEPIPHRSESHAPVPTHAPAPAPVPAPAPILLPAPPLRLNDKLKPSVNAPANAGEGMFATGHRQSVDHGGHNPGGKQLGPQRVGRGRKDRENAGDLRFWNKKNRNSGEEPWRYHPY